MTLRIERSMRQGITVFTLSGHMMAEEIAGLKGLFATAYRSIVLDLRDVRLADRDAVTFLRSCERDGMKLENCPAYVREWIEREKDLGSHELATPISERRSTVVTSTGFSSQIDAAAVSDLRAWSEQQLIASAKGGESAHFGELCERHMKRVFCVTRRIMPNREDAEDAVQDCFLNAFVHLKDFDGRSQFGTWLTRIAINVALMKLRKNRGAREVPMDEPNPSFEPVAQREFRDDAPDPEESCSARERRELLNTAILGLRPRARRVVELHQLQEHSVRETAQILGISTAAVKTRMFHARAALHRMPVLQIRSNWLSVR